VQIWQYLIPQHGLSRLMGVLANWRFRPWKNWAIKSYIRYFKVNMQEAKIEDPTEFACFNDFFIRELKPELRPLASEPAALISPVDGCISEVGKIDDERIFQAKEHYYDLGALVGDEALAKPFRDGEFLTVYLAPRDYHRIHMPIAGKLQKMIHIPGKLFSVNPPSVSSIPNIFARNERVVSLFSTEIGPMALISVGAVIVGGISTKWHGLVTPPSSRSVSQWDYSNVDISFTRGEEMGHFQLGSTVIILFAENKIRWLENLKSESPLKIGEKIGSISK
jgi:phosphatidylserine decarboxylase